MEQGLRVVGTVEFGGLENPAKQKKNFKSCKKCKISFSRIDQNIMMNG